MKKLIALLLASLMLCGTVALADPISIQEPSGLFDLTIELPEGARFHQQTVNDLTLAVISYDDPAACEYHLTIGASDVIEGKSMNDLTEEELVGLANHAAHDLYDFDFELIELDNGYKAILLKEKVNPTSIDVFTLINGYFIQIHGDHVDYAIVTDEEIQTAIQMLNLVKVTLL